MSNIQIQIQKPTRSQRDYYDGRKGFHCQSYLFLHDGSGKAVYIHGGEREATNDTTLLARSSFGRNVNRYIGNGDYVICDGAWRNEGAPFLCRFTDRTYLTAPEMAFNYRISEKRVLCENHYGRLHTLFPVLNYFRQKLDKLDVWVRASSFLTNVHIAHQAPLR